MNESIAMTLAHAIADRRRVQANEAPFATSCRWCVESWGGTEDDPIEKHTSDCVYAKIVLRVLANTIPTEDDIRQLAHAFYDRGQNYLDLRVGVENLLLEMGEL